MKRIHAVADHTDAPIANADVTITNSETNQSVKVITDTNGYYEASSLRPGSYSVKVAAPGFRTTIRSNISVLVESRLRLGFALEVGGASSTIAVTAESPLVDSETGSLGQVVTSQQLETLPIQGRNLFDLAILSPGVQANPDSLNRVPSGDGMFSLSDMSIHGGRYRTNDYLLDGVSIMLPGAQFGRSGGGILNVVTKAGTNKLHGSLYELFRHDKLGANSFSPTPPEPLQARCASICSAAPPAVTFSRTRRFSSPNTRAIAS